jgi:uncharacterized membrane protein
MNSPVSANPADSGNLTHPQLHSLLPPFSEDSAAKFATSADLRPTFQLDGRLHDPMTDRYAFLQTDLQTPKLNRVHRHLWLAGLPRPARPLHRQRLLGRAIHLTEVPDEHLIWHENYILIKPIPEYLLSYHFWKAELCHDEALHRSARGLLLSYVWIVSSKSDFNIACETGILPSNTEWNAWRSFVRSMVGGDAQMLLQVDSRYWYGELRLSRLNSLYRVGAAGFSKHNLVFGYMSSSQRYTTFFERNFGWLLAVFVYLTVILSALQVALATNKFGHDARFQSLSYGAAVMSLGVVWTAVGVVLFVWLALFLFHLVSTIRYCKKVDNQRRQSSK